MSMEPRMPRSRLSPPPREMSEFFFEQRLYDFTNKKLSPFLTEDMKKYMDDNMEAKEKVGAMLLAFEYFNAISEIKLEYDKSEFLNYRKTWFKSLKANLKIICFVILFFAFFLGLLLNLTEVVQFFSPYFETLKQVVR